MRIVPLETDSLDAVASIEAEDGDVHWSRAQFEKELSGEFRRFFVVLEGSDPSATQQALARPDVWRAGLSPAVDVLAYGGYWKAGPEAQVTNLVVRKASRCCGIGKRLMEFILDCARGEMCTACTLEVRQTNVHAQSLYKSLGFEVKGQRPKIYENPVEGSMIMEKQL